MSEFLLGLFVGIIGLPTGFIVGMYYFRHMKSNVEWSLDSLKQDIHTLHEKIDKSLQEKTP